MDTDTTNHTATAELIRGRLYIYKSRPFPAGEKVPVDEDTANELEKLVISSRDRRHGDMIEKKRFKISREVRKIEEDEDEDIGVTRRKPLRTKPSRANRT